VPLPILYLQPLGPELPEEDVRFVRKVLAAVYPLEVRNLPPALLPVSAYYPPRARYRAEKLLDRLHQLLPEDGFRILGLTGVDISTSRPGIADWGMMGLASYIRPVGVVSSFRCGPGRASRERLAKIALHEVGHTLGLPHCPTRACLMEDARGQVKVLDRAADLCLRCRAFLDSRGIDLGRSPASFWAGATRGGSGS
jgi:archaemetzincin